MDSLFSYENAGSTKQRAYFIKKDIVNGVDCAHIANNMEVEETKPLKEVTIEDANEKSTTDSKPLLTHSEGHGLGMILECSNRDKGKGMLIDDEGAKDIAIQVSVVINNAYVHDPHWSKEEYEIKVEAQETDYFQNANEEQQLHFMLEFMDKLEHERIHRIGPFVPLKEVKLRREKVNKLTS